MEIEHVLVDVHEDLEGQERRAPARSSLWDRFRGRIKELSFTNIKRKFDWKQVFREALGSFISVFIACGVASLAPSEAENLNKAVAKHVAANTTMTSTNLKSKGANQPCDCARRSKSRPRKPAIPSVSYGRHLAIAAGTGLGSLLQSYALLPFGGAHAHCIITLAYTLYNSFDAAEAIWCWVGQFGGSLLATELVRLLLYPRTCLTLPVIDPEDPIVSLWQAVAMETLITALATFIRLAVYTDPERLTDVRGSVSSGGNFVASLVGGFSSGGSTNPVRSTCAVIAARGGAHYLFIYWLGPILGGILGGFFYAVLVKSVAPGEETVAKWFRERLDLGATQGEAEAQWRGRAQVHVQRLLQVVQAQPGLQPMVQSIQAIATELGAHPHGQ